MRLMLNKKFYNEEAVKQAIEDFSEVCDCKMSDVIVVDIDPKEKSDEPVDDEFANYVLGLMMNERMV